jgi:phage terminase Nu1 subunit (DNA packaging protein)
MVKQPAYMNISEISKYLNLTEVDFLTLVNKGIIPAGTSGKYNPEKCFDAYIQHLKAISRQRRRISINTLSFEQEKARLTKFDADLIELELAIEDGFYIATNKAINELTKIITNARSKMLAIPNLLASSLIIDGNKTDTKKSIAKALKEVVTELKMPDFNNFNMEDLKR